MEERAAIIEKAKALAAEGRKKAQLQAVGRVKEALEQFEDHPVVYFDPDADVLVWRGITIELRSVSGNMPKAAPWWPTGSGGDIVFLDELAAAIAEHGLPEGSG